MQRPMWEKGGITYALHRSILIPVPVSRYKAGNTFLSLPAGFHGSPVPQSVHDPVP